MVVKQKQDQEMTQHVQHVKQVTKNQLIQKNVFMDVKLKAPQMMQEHVVLVKLDIK